MGIELTRRAFSLCFSLFILKFVHQQQTSGRAFRPSFNSVLSSLISPPFAQLQFSRRSPAGSVALSSQPTSNSQLPIVVISSVNWMSDYPRSGLVRQEIISVNRYLLMNMRNLYARAKIFGSFLVSACSPLVVRILLTNPVQLCLQVTNALIKENYDWTEEIERIESFTQKTLIFSFQWAVTSV